MVIYRLLINPNYITMLTLQEFARMGGKKSAEKRLAGKNKEEISEIMKELRKKGRQRKEV